MNPLEMVVIIVAIVTIGNIIRVKQMAKYGLRDDRGSRRSRHRDEIGGFGSEDYDRDDTAETVRLREEVRMLKERIHTLERITVDKENSLSRQIDDLRNQ
ncbi:hypothetical protein H9L12_05295 [Sphingomonas rhizophila]|uniref:Uncharacterized protein n=1 Tax=Sphingomonas rhizophila TaxID=2071607 RepID=A0A7G9SDL1_9SPHN|nr:hypothetical protein [Sphingomonas rhizophila]QNN65936.1 hypothetical protein H9L12_05295 [Sphingomonas rhizophila]